MDHHCPGRHHSSVGELYQRKPRLIRQNKWRAARYGLDAQLVQGPHYELQPARKTLADLAKTLRPVADTLSCTEYLQQILEIASKPTWAERQLQIFKRTGSTTEVVREMIAQSRL